MKRTSVSENEIREMDDYLKGYAFHQKMIEMDEYEREFFYSVKKNAQGEIDIPLARVKLFEIRHFVMDMENSDEKLLLYYHYVKGETMEQCAELIGMSRATAFRMKKRALAMAVLHRRKMNHES